MTKSSGTNSMDSMKIQKMTRILEISLKSVQNVNLFGSRFMVVTRLSAEMHQKLLINWKILFSFLNLSTNIPGKTENFSIKNNAHLLIKI